MAKSWTIGEAPPYFSREELACSCCGTVLLDRRFAVALPYLRQRLARPLFPTSVCRCPSHNAEVGGHPSSLHLTENPKHPTAGTMAADLYWGDWSPGDRRELVGLAEALGWSVGLHPTFCHVDRRVDFGLAQGKFVYDGWNPGLLQG